MGMGGSDECRNDNLLIVMGYKYIYMDIYIYIGASVMADILLGGL